jgi:tRNA(adenine34) deaminase
MRFSMTGTRASDNHEQNMRLALDLAREALDRGEFPVGCIMVYDGRIVATGARRGTVRQIPSELEHAEMIALRRLESGTQTVNREAVTVYATMEPCLMCFGALLIAGIGTIVYAYEDAMGGGTTCDRRGMPPLYRDHCVRIVPGVCRGESLDLFKRYFSDPDSTYWRNSLLADYTLSQP